MLPDPGSNYYLLGDVVFLWHDKLHRVIVTDVSTMGFNESGIVFMPDRDFRLLGRVEFAVYPI